MFHNVDTVQEHPGYIGMFSRDTYPGAMPPGTRIRKVSSEVGDGHPDGSLGTVLGSIGAEGLGWGYFIEWDARPKMPVFTMALKVERA